MEKIFLSDSGPKVSQAIYGFWRWVDEDANDVSKMEHIIQLCIELGINTFDHSDVYGGYQCETLFGKVMANKGVKREDLVLFTKCGRNLPHPNRPDFLVPHTNTSAAHITTTLENSLRNLRTDYVDIFLLDGLDPISPVEETALALEKLRTSGKVKHIGVANFSVFQHQLLASLLRVPIVTNHLHLNVLNTTALDNGQLDYIKQRYMRALASEPLGGGRIETGTDRQAIRVRGILESLEEKYGANVESLAVAWLNKLGAIPLIGTMVEERIRNIVRSFEIQLDHQDWYAIYQAGKEGIHIH